MLADETVRAALAGPAALAALALAAPMPAPLFHRKAGDDGVQELKLVHDPSRGSLILRVGSGRKQKDARLPKVDPLEKARTLLRNAIPEHLVDILSRWKPEQMDEVRRGSRLDCNRTEQNIT